MSNTLINDNYYFDEVSIFLCYMKYNHKGVTTSNMSLRRWGGSRVIIGLLWRINFLYTRDGAINGQSRNLVERRCMSNSWNWSQTVGCVRDKMTGQKCQTAWSLGDIKRTTTFCVPAAPVTRSAFVMHTPRQVNIMWLVFTKDAPNRLWSGDGLISLTTQNAWRKRRANPFRFFSGKKCDALLVVYCLPS